GGVLGRTHVGTTARNKSPANIDPALAIPLTAGTQYHVEKIMINRNISVCAGGCPDEVCLVFNMYATSLLTGGEAPKWEVDAGGVNPPYITWQQGGSPVFNCPIPTPTRSRSWGEIKSLYR